MSLFTCGPCNCPCLLVSSLDCFYSKGNFHQGISQRTIIKYAAQSQNQYLGKYQDFLDCACDALSEAEENDTELPTIWVTFISYAEDVIINGAYYLWAISGESFIGKNGVDFSKLANVTNRNLNRAISLLEAPLNTSISNFENWWGEELNKEPFAYSECAEIPDERRRRRKSNDLSWEVTGCDDPYDKYRNCW
jgi:hypothetical protein